MLSQRTGSSRGTEATVSSVAHPFGGASSERLLRQSTGCLACEAARVRKRLQCQTPGRSSDQSSRGTTGFDTQMTPGKTELFGAPSGAPGAVRNGDRCGSTSSAQRSQFPSGSEGELQRVGLSRIDKGPLGMSLLHANVN